MNMLCCPKCKEELVSNGSSFICQNNHCYDISKSGYVNLLLSNQMNAKIPGDNKLMVNARRDFLNKGYYAKLLNTVCSAVKKYAVSDVNIIDAGCGEGYYTDGIYEFVKSLSPEILGIDISKNALDSASKRSKGKESLKYAVASVFHIPVKDECADMAVTLFAPFCREEMLRILKYSGILMMVIPAKDHLWEMKKAIYDEPYKNEEKDFKIEGFKLLEKINCTDRIYIDNNQDIVNLFSMTPYYYKTSVEGSRRISELKTLETQLDFDILIYSKL